MNQLQPIGEIDAKNYNYDVKEYRELIINTIFPTQLTLSTPKRLKKNEDINKIMDLKDDIFDCINDINKLSSVKNICYFKFRRNLINKKINNYKELKRGQELLCIKYLKIDKIRLFVNYSYTLMDNDNNNYYVKSDDDITNIKKYFGIILVIHMQILAIVFKD